MSLLEESPVSPAAPAAEPQLEYPHFSVTFPAGGGEPTYTAMNEAADLPEPEPESAPSAPTETPPAQAPEPAAEPTEPEKPPLNYAEVFGSIGDDEFREQLRSHPRLKRFLDGELGSRIAAERERIRTEAVAELNEQVETFNAAWEKYQEIEQLRIDDPETFAQRYDNTAYAAWVADVHRNRDYLIAQQAIRPSQVDPQAANVEAIRNELWNEFQVKAIDGIGGILKGIPDVAQFPQDVRRNLAAIQLTPDGNWLQEYTDNLIRGMKTYYGRQLREATEAARAASRQEAEASEAPDQPMPTAGRSDMGNRSPDEILVEHARNGFRTWVTQSMLDAVYDAKGMR